MGIEEDGYYLNFQLQHRKIAALRRRISGINSPQTGKKETLPSCPIIDQGLLIIDEKQAGTFPFQLGDWPVASLRHITLASGIEPPILWHDYPEAWRKLRTLQRLTEDAMLHDTASILVMHSGIKINACPQLNRDGVVERLRHPWLLLYDRSAIVLHRQGYTDWYRICGSCLAEEGMEFEEILRRITDRFGHLHPGGAEALPLTVITTESAQ